MGRAPCCDKANVKKGPWSPEEDAKLKEYIEKYGTGGNWIALPQKAGLKRCGKSCRLRWLNYLRPNIKHGEFTEDEDRIICTLFSTIGSRWSIIAAQLPGRTDNDIKNYWNTKLKKKLMGLSLIPLSQTKSLPPTISSFLQTSSSASSAYKDRNSINSTNYKQPTWSFTNYEPVSHSSCTSSASVLQFPQEMVFMDPIQQYQVKDSVFMFGGEPSCSSSDGSCTNQTSQGREIEYNYRGGGGGGGCGGDERDGGSNSAQMGFQFQSFLYNGVEENQKQNGIWGEMSQLDYGLEEIKQLISTSNCSTFFVDENKTEGRVMYY